MKKFLLSTLVFSTIAISHTAQAQSKRMYFAGYLGFSGLNDLEYSENTTPSSGEYEAENTLNFAGALGLRINRNFRMEAEVSYNNSDIESANVNGTGSTPVNGDLDTLAFMINGYYDFNIRDWKTQPYVSAGIGVGRHNGDIVDPNGFSANVDDTGYSFLYNIGTGLKYRVRDNFAWTAGYRYVDGSDFDLGGTDIDYSAHEIRVGMEWDLAY